MNYPWRPEQLEAIREQERPLVEVGARLCQEQDREGRLYLGENPLRSALWQEPSIQNARNLANNLEVTCDAGAYDAETSGGWPIQKPHKWVSDQQSAHYSRLNDYNTASPRTRSTTRRPFKA